MLSMYVGTKIDARLILEMGIDENAPDVRLAQPKSAMNLFSLDTCCLTRKVIFLVGTILPPKMKICDAGG